MEICKLLASQQESEEQWTPRTTDQQVADQQVAFDLPSLRARLKRQRDTAAADLMATHQGSKRGRFEAASLQVSLGFQLASYIGMSVVTAFSSRLLQSGL